MRHLSYYIFACSILFISCATNYEVVFQGSLAELGKMFNGKAYTQYYNEQPITPKDGFNKFKTTLDCFHLHDLTDKPPISMAIHQPFSTYVIEFKNNNKFNTFRFDTHYPLKAEDNDIYASIEQYIFEQFGIKNLFKFKKRT